MTESLYQPLPDVDAYLKRIGMQRGEATLGYLDELIYAHQCAVPFEDLDISDKGLNVSLGKADLFDKIITRHRGGYCFELNGAFYSLLDALGFDVRASMARVLTRPIPYPLISHRANIVTFDGVEYLVDVGFGGPMPAFALELADGVERTGHGQTFTVSAFDDDWWDIGYVTSAGERKPAMRICTMPVGEHDFIALSFYQAQNPQSFFRNTRRVNVRTADGAHDICNNTYTHYHNGERDVCELETAAELDEVLAQHFGIVDWR